LRLAEASIRIPISSCRRSHPLPGGLRDKRWEAVIERVGRRFHLIQFLIAATVISLSGVLAPGSITAATLAAGTRRRHAGAMIALGHAVIEFPLMLLIVAGAGKAFELTPVRLSIGIGGGLFLLVMGGQLLLAARRETTELEGASGRHPFVTGIVLSGTNPYFLIWWATVGLALATRAVELGVIAFALFAIIHWLCDLVWLEALSLASHKGSELLGGRVQQVVLAVCGVALLAFGCKFLWDAGSKLVG